MPTRRELTDDLRTTFEMKRINHGKPTAKMVPARTGTDYISRRDARRLIIRKLSPGLISAIMPKAKCRRADMRTATPPNPIPCGRLALGARRHLRGQDIGSGIAGSS